MAAGGAPVPEEETVVLPDWVMLDRIFRSRWHDDLDAAREAVNKNKTAAPVEIDSGHSCFVSFTLAAPPGVSYFNLHWPVKEGSATLFAFVRATDKNLVLFDISIPSRTRYMDAPPDLFVYTVAGPSPSVQQLPLRSTRRFLAHKFTTGILQLPENRYIVADLNVYPEEKGMRAELCVLNSDTSGTREWTIIPNIPADQLPNIWYTDDVLAFDGRFLCWIDYFSGVLLCDFSDIESPVLNFVPFPGGKKYPDEALFPRYFPGRFRSVSISQGMMRYVHIDNDFHETVHSGWKGLAPERSQGQQQHPHNITIWTLNSKFEWEVHHEINLHCLWAQRGYQAREIPKRLPEFPIVSVDDPDVLCCLLREDEFYGKEWMIMVDMNHAYLRSCTDVDVDNEFANNPLLPTVLSKYLQKANRDDMGQRQAVAEPACSRRLGKAFAW